MQTSTIEATWRGVDGHAQKGWYDIRLTHRLVNATGETILPAGRIAAGRLNEREDQPSLSIEVPAAGTDDTADWFLVAYVNFQHLRTAETYVLEPVAPGEVIDLALQVPVKGVPEGLGGGTVVRGIDGKDGRGIKSIELDGDTLTFTYDDDTVEIVTVEGGFGGGGTEPDAPGRGIESLTQVDPTTLEITYTDKTTQTLTLPRGEDGDDADPLTVIDEFFDEDGNTVVTFSDDTSITVTRGQNGQDAKPLTVTGQRLTDDNNTVVIFSDGSEVTVPGGTDGEDGDDAAPLTVLHTQEVAEGVRVTFSDNTSVTVPRGKDGEDGKDFTYDDFTAEQLAALRGPRGYGGRGVVSILDEDGDGTATVTYTDGETAELPLPAGAGGGEADLNEFTTDIMTAVEEEFMQAIMESGAMNPETGQLNGQLLVDEVRRNIFGYDTENRYPILGYLTNTVNLGATFNGWVDEVTGDLSIPGTGIYSIPRTHLEHFVNYAKYALTLTNVTDEVQSVSLSLNWEWTGASGPSTTGSGNLYGPGVGESSTIEVPPGGTTTVICEFSHDLDTVVDGTNWLTSAYFQFSNGPWANTNEPDKLLITAPKLIEKIGY